VALRLLDDLEPTGWITEDFFLLSAELKCSIEELEAGHTEIARN
jgi:hypothetical protein